MKRICKKCGLEKPYIKSKKRYAKQHIYLDDRGVKWNGNICSECARKDCTSLSRRNGIPPRELVKDPNWQKGYRTEVMAANFFKRLGYSVEISSGNGPDLVCSGKHGKITVEVKSVSYGTRHRWRTSAVYDKRKNDDYVCIVFDSGKIIIQPLKYHLSACAKNGRRSVFRLSGEQ